MKIKELVWIGTRTEHFEAMLDFCQNVMGLTPAFVEPGFAALDMPNGDRFEIFGADSPYNTFYTHPVVGFLVEDIPAARAEMEASGIEFIDLIHTEEDGNAWTHFRAPDGFVYSLTFVPGHPGN
jgi:catechol 2,3-dioxygenase-like lactoylglutathione lyase family enzyme